MNRDYNQYDLSSLILDNQSMSVISEEANAKYNNTAWRNYAVWGPMQISKNWSSVVQNDEIEVVASILSPSSQKPKRSISGASTYGGSIAKIGHGFELTEDDYIFLDELALQSGNNFAMTLLDKYFNKTQALYGGMHARLNTFVFEGLTTGRITGMVNADGIPLDVDLKFQKNHILKPEVVWSAGSGVKIIKDLQRMCKVADDDKVPYDHFEMTKSLSDVVVNDPDVIALIAKRKNLNVTDFPFTKNEILYELSVGFDIPPIVIIDEKSMYEEDGIPMPRSGAFEPNTVILLNSGSFFEMKNSMSIYHRDNNPASRKSFVEGGRFATMLRFQSETLTNITDMEAWALPVPRDPKKIVIMKTNEAA